MDYDEKLYTELAMTVLEHDIDWIASRYWIPGYELDDLKQELRLELWKKIKMFDHTKEIRLRTWANTVMRNHMRRLLRDANAKKRGGDCEMVDFDYIVQKDLGNPDDFIDFLDKIHELGLDLDDFI
jgi:RNA polymerase sigma factor (sigma-70 family)